MLTYSCSNSQKVEWVLILYIAYNDKTATIVPAPSSEWHSSKIFILFKMQMNHFITSLFSPKFGKLMGFFLNHGFISHQKNVT